MNEKSKKIYFLAAVIVFVITAGTLTFIWIDESLNYRLEDNLTPINLTGSYTLQENNIWYPLPKEGFDGLSNYNKLTIKGYFDDDIPKNQQFIMRVDNLKVRINVNGSEIYSFGYENSHPPYSRSAGNLWKSFPSPGLKTTDIVIIELENNYNNHVDTAFSNFLMNLYFGYEGDMIRHNISENWFKLCAAFFLICLGIIAFLYASLLTKIHKAIYHITCFGLLSFFTGIWFFIHFDVQNYFISSPVFNNTLDIVSMMFTITFLLFYYALFLKTKWKYILLAASYSTLFLLVIAAITQLAGIWDYYDYSFYLTFHSVVSILLILSGLIYELIDSYSVELRQLLYASLILCAGMTGDVLCNVLDIYPYLYWFKISFFIFLLIQFCYLARIIRNILLENTKTQLLESQKKDLANKNRLDPLTLLHTKETAREEIIKLLFTSDENTSFVFYMVNMDCFSQINTSLGYQIGDYILKESGNCLRRIFDEKSVIGRSQGDEFFVFSQIKNQEYAKNKAKEIIEKLHKNISVDSVEIVLSVSIGIAIYPINGLFFEDLYRNAEEALYLAKRSGKNRYRIYPKEKALI